MEIEKEAESLVRTRKEVQVWSLTLVGGKKEG